MKRPMIFVLIMMLILAASVRADEWTPITPPNPPDGRAGHTMVSLPDGRVMLFGGEGDQGELKDDLFAYDANGWNNVVPANAPPPKRKEHQAWTMGSKMFVYGGYGENGALDDMWTYDTESNEWYEPVVGSKPPARSGHTTTAISDGSIVILGGKDENGKVLNDFWKYTLSGYQQLPDCPVACSNHVANTITIDNEEMLIVFGWGIIAMYQFSLDMWQLTSGGPSLINACSATGVNDVGGPVIFVFGGRDNSGKENLTVYEFDTTTGELTQRDESMPRAMSNGACALLGVAPSGFKHSPLLWQTGISTSQQYNISLLVFGGLSGGIRTNNTYIFTPISPPDSITVVSPFDSVAADSVLLIWNHATPLPATHYQVQVTSDAEITIFLADTVVTDTSYLVKELSDSTDYWWRVRGYNAGGWGVYNTPVHFSVDYVTSVGVNGEPHLEEFYLHQNYPNPFNPSTMISYLIPNPDIVTLKIYDMLGREVQTLVNEFQEANTYSVHFDASKLSSGIYFYRLQVGKDFLETRKMLIIQ